MITRGDLPTWVSDSTLAGFWTRMRARLESAGLQPQGRLTVEGASRAERHALGALLGHTVTRERVRIDLAALDERLAERTGLGGLVAVTAAVTGSPLRDLPRERQEDRERRTQPLERARTLLSGSWVEPWLAGLAASGLLSNRAEAMEVVDAAAKVLPELVGGEAVRAPSPSQPVAQSRVQLAARLLGDAHALDQDRLVHHVVLRGLAAVEGVPVPTSATARQALWERHGVSADQVSATCLCLGLTMSEAVGLATRLRVAAEDGGPVHLTAWELRRTPYHFSTEENVLVCENPRVLEAVAETYGGFRPVVCTSGEPNTVVLQVLRRLADGGAVLRYHGDFDWPGVAIANRLVGRFGVCPWLMSTEDYENGLQAGSPQLAGAPVEPAWDKELGAAMRSQNRVVHEEAVLDRLLEALA